MPQDPPSTSFKPLPRPLTAAGDERRVGVEIEFAGLTETETADLVIRHLGGEITKRSRHSVRVENTALGRCDIELDTALKAWDENQLVNAGLNAARALIPVEIVTEPLDWRGLERLDAFRDTLRQAGAIGTHDGILLGFGVHLNIAITDYDDPYTGSTVLAFALLEDWLRAAMPIDTTRRLMPFVDRWPAAFVEAMARRAPAPDMTSVRDSYARHCTSRNFALDLLPIFAHADPDGFESLFPKQTNTKGRPAFHYRLPDSRVDESDWSLSAEWDRWCVVETVADTPDMLATLAEDYLNLDRPLIGGDDVWAQAVEDRLSTAGLAPAQSPEAREASERRQRQA